MPPRYSYWTILAGGLPTAFRAAERADLLPTFNRIREKHPDAEMKWFARGRLWSSPEDAQAYLQRARTRRDRDWRPGGEHRDPRQQFKFKSKGAKARDSASREEQSRRPFREGKSDRPLRHQGSDRPFRPPKAGRSTTVRRSSGERGVGPRKRQR